MQKLSLQVRLKYMSERNRMEPTKLVIALVMLLNGCAVIYLEQVET